MRRIVLAFMTTLVAVVMLFGYRTSTPTPTSSALAGPVATDTGGTTTGSTGTSAGSSSTGSSGSSSTSSRTSSTVQRYTGGVAQTRWGPVQVRITVSGGRITHARAVQVPSGNGRSDEINGYAVPILDSEVVSSQGKAVDAVSGATVTSDGYLSSLQSALDAAHL